MTEHIYGRIGDLTLPIPVGTVTGSLTALDPVRSRLLALFKAAISAELGPAWNAAAVTTPLATRQVVQSTLEFEPTAAILQQSKHELPILALHRFGDATYENETLEIDRVTQNWLLHYILGPLEVGHARLLADILTAVPRVIVPVVRHRAHPAFEGGKLQFFPDQGGLASLRVVSSQAGQATYAERSETLYYAAVVQLQSTERFIDVPDAFGPFDAVSYDFTIGGGEGLIPGLLYADTDPPYQDP